MTINRIVYRYKIIHTIWSQEALKERLGRFPSSETIDHFVRNRLKSVFDDLLEGLDTILHPDDWRFTMLPTYHYEYVENVIVIVYVEFQSKDAAARWKMFHPDTHIEEQLVLPSSKA